LINQHLSAFLKEVAQFAVPQMYMTEVKVPFIGAIADIIDFP
jgi:hypothetical protein